jgi:hypothetical protein
MDERLESLILDYIDQIREDLALRWNAWRLDLRENEIHEVVGVSSSVVEVLKSSVWKVP